MKVRIALTVLGCLLLGGQDANAKRSAPAATTAGPKYTNEQKKFSVHFPKNWEVKENIMGATVVALAPTTNTAADAFRENINVVVEPLPQTMTTKVYYEDSLKILKKLFTDFKLEKAGHGSLDRQVAADKTDAYWSIYTHRMGKLRAKVLQYMTVVGTNAYVITCSATPDTFNKYRPAFDSSIKTFKAE